MISEGDFRTAQLEVMLFWLIGIMLLEDILQCQQLEMKLSEKQKDL